MGPVGTKSSSISTNSGHLGTIMGLAYYVLIWEEDLFKCQQGPFILVVLLSFGHIVHFDVRSLAVRYARLNLLFDRHEDSCFANLYLIELFHLNAVFFFVSLAIDVRITEEINLLESPRITQVVT